MADFVEATVRDIDSRLKELGEEVKRLEAARSALVGTGAAPADRPDRRGKPRRSRTPPAGRAAGARGSSRATQTLELVQAQPGITIPQIAEAMSIEPNYLYRVLPRLVSEGQVRRDGKGWYPAAG